MIFAEHFCFRVGDFALRDVTLAVPTGEYFVLLGPPGSGKSLFLECICGLRRPSGGRLFLEGRDVTCVEPRCRQIGYVPQDGVLFPHLTVAQNVGFGLLAGRMAAGQVASRVAQTADMLEIGHLLGRFPRGLSGGEAQRVALARALALEPRVLLLDEPVSALDECTRQEICRRLLDLRRRLGLTVVHVSHNREEAFSVADRAGVLGRGVLQQVGAMSELVRRPCNEFVARFLRCENLFAGEPEPAVHSGSSTWVRIGQVRLLVPGLHRTPVMVMIRPEDVRLHPLDGPEPSGVNCLPARLVDVRDFGNHLRLELQGTLPLVAHVFGADRSLRLEPGSILMAELPPDRLHPVVGC